MDYYTATLELLNTNYKARAHLKDTVVNYRLKQIQNATIPELSKIAREGLKPIDSMLLENVLYEFAGYSDYSEKEVYTSLYNISR